MDNKSEMFLNYNKLNKVNKRQRIPKGQSKKDNLEKLTIQGTQDIENKTNTTKYVLDTSMRKQTQHNMCWTPVCANKHK